VRRCRKWLRERVPRWLGWTSELDRDDKRRGRTDRSRSQQRRAVPVRPTGRRRQRRSLQHQLQRQPPGGGLSDRVQSCGGVLFHAGAALIPSSAVVLRIEMLRGIERLNATTLVLQRARDTPPRRDGVTLPARPGRGLFCAGLIDDFSTGSSVFRRDRARHREMVLGTYVECVIRGRESVARTCCAEAMSAATCSARPETVLWVAGGCRSACLSRFRGDGICIRLQSGGVSSARKNAP